MAQPVQPPVTNDFDDRDDGRPSGVDIQRLWELDLDEPEAPMAVCKSCGDEVDKLVSVKLGGKTKKLCEDCADREREQAEIAKESESVVQDMMGFKGRR